MTRKRFIKLVMSYEVQRNEAEAMTSLVYAYGTYELAYQQIVWRLRMRKAKNTTVRAIKKGGRAMAAAVKAAAAVIKAMPFRYALASLQRKENSHDLSASP